MKGFREAMRRMLVLSNSVSRFEKIGRWIYDSSFRTFIRKVAGGFPEIESVYVRNSFADGSWTPWESDIDITIVTRLLGREEETVFLNKFWKEVFRYPGFRSIFRHIDIFDRQEFAAIISDSSGQLSYLRENIMPVEGPGEEGGHLLREDMGRSAEIKGYRHGDWMYAYILLLEERSRPGPLHRYRSSFRKILRSADEMTGPFRDLREITARMDRHPASPETRRDLVVEGLRQGLLCASDRLRKRSALMGSSAGGPGEFSVVIGQNGVEKRIEEAADAFCGGLGAGEGDIESVILAPEPFERDAYRLWIILGEGLKNDLFPSLIRYAAGEYHRKLKKDAIFPAIVTADILDGIFLSDLRSIFGYFHIERTGKVLLGDGIMDRLTVPSREALIDSAYNSLPVFSGAIRDALRPDKPDHYREFCLYRTLAVYIFLKRKVIATSPERITDLLMQDPGVSREERGLLERVSQGRGVRKEELFDLCRNKVEESFRLIHKERGSYDNVCCRSLTLSS
ncbi:MAG: hypothetical protein WC515_04080 [Candidatus Omnitrophota bacterium]